MDGRFDVGLLRFFFVVVVWFLVCAVVAAVAVATFGGILGGYLESFLFFSFTQTVSVLFVHTS